MSTQTIIEKHAVYKQYDEEIERLEQQLAEARTRRTEVAKQILTEHGKGPHALDGKDLIVANRGDSYFLRTPFGGPKKAAPSDATP